MRNSLLIIICLLMSGCAATIETFDKDNKLTGKVKASGFGSVEGETPEGYKIKKGVINFPDFKYER